MGAQFIQAEFKGAVYKEDTNAFIQDTEIYTNRMLDYANVSYFNFSIILDKFF